MGAQVKLTYVAYSPLDLQSANSIQTYNTCRALSERLGADLTVIVPRFGLSEKAPPFRVVQFPRIPVNKISRLLKSAIWSYIERTLYAWLVVAYLWAHPADVIYSRDVICAFWLVLLGLPVIYETHDLEALHPSKFKGARLSRWLERIDERTLRGAAAVVSLTQTFKNELVRWGWQPETCVFVVPDAFDEAIYYPRPQQLARERLGLPAQALVAGYAGMTFAYRRLDLLLDALKTWNEPRARALIIGGRPFEVKELKARAHELGLEHVVEWREREPAAAAAEDLSAADVLVIPDTVTDATASPLKMFEYMALERAIVAVDRPALREILGDDAEFFRPGDAADFARVLCALAAAPDRRQALAAAARARAANYTYGQRADRIITACRTTVSRRPTVGNRQPPTGAAH
ncbi:MAG: glycosyltransferase [Anaerolineae bacterium]